MSSSRNTNSSGNAKPHKNETPLIWIGGKSRAIAHITAHFPSDLVEMVSPFVGGGSIEVHMAAQGVQVHAYDGDQLVAGCWDYVLRDASRVQSECRKLYPIDSREKFDRLAARMHSLPNCLERAALHLALVRASYGASPEGGMSPQSRRFNRRTLWKLRGLDVPMMSVRWANFHESLARHPDVFAYLDPPYLLPQNRNYYRPNFDHDQFFEAIKDRPNWVQSNADNQLVRERYAGFRLVPLEWAYGTRRGSSELLIFSR